MIEIMSNETAVLVLKFIILLKCIIFSTIDIYVIRLKRKQFHTDHTVC
jgi:hypothetical protein